MAINKPTGVDFLLNILAGGAKGVETGLAQRQKSSLAKEQQKALDDYRTRTLDIQEKGLTQDLEQGLAASKARAEQSRLDRESREKLGTTFEQKKTLKSIEAGKADPTWFSKLTGIGSLEELADVQNTMTRTAQVQQEIDYADDLHQIKLDANDRAKDQWSFEKWQTHLDRLDKFAMNNYNEKNKQVNIRLNAALRQLADRDPIPRELDMHRNLIEIYREIVFDPLITDKETKKQAAKDFAASSKKMEALLDDLGIQFESEELDWEDPWFGGLKFHSVGGSGQVDDPNTNVIDRIRGAGSQIEPLQIPGLEQAQSTGGAARGGFNELDALMESLSGGQTGGSNAPLNLPFIGPPEPAAKQPKYQPVEADVTSLIDRLSRNGIEEITPEIEKQLKEDFNFTAAQIKRVKRAFGEE